MQVEDINTLRTKLTERLVQRGLQSFRSVHAWLRRVTFRCYAEALVRILGIGGEFLLGAIYVHSSGVELGVAVLGEMVEAGVIVVEGCDTGTFIFCAWRTEGHAAEDDSGFGRGGGGWDEHLGQGCCEMPG